METIGNFFYDYACLVADDLDECVNAHWYTIRQAYKIFSNIDTTNI